MPRVCSETSEDDVHFPVCNCDGYMPLKRCCLQKERLNATMAPLSVFMKNSDSLSCQTLAVSCFNTVMNKEKIMLGNPLSCCPKQLHLCDQHSPISALCRYHTSSGQKVAKASRDCSPFPPPLLPADVDDQDSMEESAADCLALDNRYVVNAKQPPSLLPVKTTCSMCEHKDKMSVTEESANLEETFLFANQENLMHSDKLEKVENATAFQVLMARINEKLKSIETIDTAKLFKSDGKTDANINLWSFITSLLHNGKANDCNFMDLLRQHDKEVENKIIQTRFRKRQKNLFSIQNSPESSLLRRQSLQIKRERANFEKTLIKKRANCERNAKQSEKVNTLQPNKPLSHGMLKGTLQNHENKERVFSPVKISLPVCQEETLELPLDNLEANSAFVAFSKNNSKSSQTDLTKMHGNCGLELHMDQGPAKGGVDDDGMLASTKHNIIPPVWCSVYVTNNFLFQKSSKTKNADWSEEDKTRNDCQAKACSNDDVKKIVRNANLHVVVERLEDAISMAQKNKEPLFNGYKISSKLKDIQKNNTNQNSQSGLIGMNETGSKGQYVLSQAHVPCEYKCKRAYRSTKEKGSDDGYKSILKSSPFHSGALASNNEGLQTNADIGGSLPAQNYTSPIKLMFLSEINSSEGVKYTLTSVSDSAKLNIDLHSVHREASVLLEKQLEVREPSKNISVEESGYDGNEKSHKNDVKSVFPAVSGNETNDVLKPNSEPVEQSNSGSSVKRKPGRPKKLGPQAVKLIKRPIGRPPKPKAEHANHPCDSISAGQSSSSKTEALEEDTSNRNITVTVVFGRSRRTKRCVSEGSLSVIGVLPGSHSACAVVNEHAQVRQNLEASNTLLKNNGLQNASENKASAFGYEYVRPLESSPVLPFHCSNIVRPNQKPLNVIRKPGRPAKVKISGISVTVNQISSQGRQVSISSCLPPLEHETVLGKCILSKENDKPCNKRENTKSLWNDTSKDYLHNRITTAKKKPDNLSKQILRDRRTSLPFLHSLVSSSSFSRRSAFLQKSYQLCLKNAKSKKIKHSNKNITPKDTSVNENSGNARKSSNNLFRSINEMSTDPIFSPNPSLKWWDPSISSDTLLKELNSRYEQITNTWLHVNGEDFEKCLYEQGCHIEQDCSFNVSKPLDTCILQFENSPIKMLFQKKCNLNELCTWFMQTTETQSLSLVRKANARNPFEVISSRQFKMGTRQSDCNTSPFRKHFKKFALSTPSKSAENLKFLQKIVRNQVLNRRRHFTLAKLRKTEFKNLQHDRWKQVKKIYHGLNDWKSKKRNLRFFCQSKCFANASNNKVCVRQKGGTIEAQSPAVFIKSHKIISSTGSDIRDAIFQQKTELSERKTQPILINNSKQSTPTGHYSQQNTGRAEIPTELGKSAWTDKTLKDCRIFLKKINPIKEQNSFNKNTVVCTPESVDHSTSHDYFQEKRHCTLRSKNEADRYDKDAESSEGANHSSLGKGLHIERGTKKSSDRVTFDDSPIEVPKNQNKRRRTQCKPTDMNVRKRKKKRLCSSGQLSSCFAKYQLGKFYPISFPHPTP